jgi:hypothetical protein
MWAALGLIVFYFALQVVSGTLIVLLIGIAEGFTHVLQGTANLHAVLRTVPAMPAITAIFTLMVSASLTLLMAYRKWPRLWSMALPPGLGFVLPARPLYFVLAIAAGLAAPVLGGLLTQLLAHGHKVSQDIQQLGGQTSSGLRIPLMLTVTSVGPLVEELLFRGVLLSALMQRWRSAKPRRSARWPSPWSICRACNGSGTRCLTCCCWRWRWDGCDFAPARSGQAFWRTA